ncbi:hypothetical protein NDU88_002531 [Pleurodeles waltl]|uniref:Basic proline-rich protein-like n=1 Tax=Pleurodeles waltl TaxID=8319 RepID=A0AAV7SDH6_PLEWA|nr:hypothetical protein NDU88_002531 [Pleurodeles waltl]
MARPDGRAAPEVPGGVRGPGSGPPILQPFPARVSGGPGEASPAVPGVRGPGSGPPSLPCPDGPRPVPQGPRRLRGLLELKQSASRWPPSPAIWPHREPRASGRPPCWFAMARPDGRAAADVPMRAHLLPHAHPGLQEVGCVLADGPLHHSVRTNSQEGPISSSGLLGTGYAGPPRGPVVQGFSTGRPGPGWPGWRGRLLAPSSDGSLLRTWLPREQTAAPGPASTVHRSIGHTWSVWGWTAWPASAVVSSTALPTPPGTVRLGGLPFLGRPFPAERRPSSPAACALQAVRPELKGVGWCQVPGSRPPAVRAPECRRLPPPPPSAFSPAARNDRSVGRPRRSRPTGTPASPAQAAPRPGRLHPAEAAGARRFPCDRPVQDSPRRARGYSPQQGASPKALGCLPERNTPRHRARPSSWRIPGWRSGPRPPGRLGERTGRGCSLLRPGGPDPLVREGPGRVREGRAHASPAPDPLGAVRRKSEAPPETEPTPTRHDPGRENRIEVPPRAGTTPERPAVLGRQGGLDEEEPGPRQGTTAPRRR